MMVVVIGNAIDYTVHMSTISREIISCGQEARKDSGTRRCSPSAACGGFRALRAAQI
jgi:hypothetical protein